MIAEAVSAVFGLKFGITNQPHPLFAIFLSSLKSVELCTMDVLFQ